MVKIFDQIDEEMPEDDINKMTLQPTKFDFLCVENDFDLKSMSQRTSISQKSVSDQRKERGKAEALYDPTVDLIECWSEAHFAQISYNEALQVANKEIEKLDQTIDKIRKIEVQAVDLCDSSRNIGK